MIDKSMSKAEAVVSKMETTAADGKRYNTNYYNLDAIIAVVYCIHSKKATINHGYLHSVQCFDVVLPFLQTETMLEKAAFDVIRQASEENVIYTEEIRRNNFKIYVAKPVRTSAIMYV
mgnify:CR=1 FL=1